MDIEAIARSRDLGRQVNEELQQIIDEADKTSIAKLETTYHSVLNQPSLIAVSSTSAIPPTGITFSVAETAFNSFTVNLPRPALNVKSVQILSMNAPQAQVNIPDNALCFWFYKMATQNITWNQWDDTDSYVVGDQVTWYSEVQNKDLNWVCIQATGSQEPVENSAFWAISSSVKYESPNLFNLFCVRILPSYYKRELLPSAINYPINRTYTSYEDLATALEKATTLQDLSLYKGAQNDLTALNSFDEYTPAASANEIRILYASSANKFVFEGLKTFVPGTIPDWNANTLYPSQSLVEYTPEGSGTPLIYYNRTPEKTYPPDNLSPATSWFEYEYDANTVWNTYLLSGYNDPNVIALQGGATNLEWNPYHLFQPGSKGIYYKGNEWYNIYLTQNEEPPGDITYWSPTVQYEAGDLVFLPGEFGNPDEIWRCVEPNIDYNPGGGSDYWVEIYNPWRFYQYEISTGMNYISQKYDFGSEYTFLKVLGIPGQPFTIFRNIQSPNNQTLNKILGFTWNGSTMIVPFEVIPASFRAGSLVTLFINRLRPVPSYAYALERLLGVPAPTFVSLPQYTADAFCNLVYSSTITIYTRILGGSTTDTVRNTNLLGIMPLNCGNLGVTFSANFIDNPLTKVDNDIYSIEFEFRTDNDQPYWFSNNSVITMQLRLTYE